MHNFLGDKFSYPPPGFVYNIQTTWQHSYWIKTKFHNQSYNFWNSVWLYKWLEYMATVRFYSYFNKIWKSEGGGELGVPKKSDLFLNYINTIYWKITEWLNAVQKKLYSTKNN